MCISGTVEIDKWLLAELLENEEEHCCRLITWFGDKSAKVEEKKEVIRIVKELLEEEPK